MKKLKMGGDEDTSKRKKEIKACVDIIIRHKGGIVLIKRKNEPKGWALPGGILEPGESLEQAAVREAKEETGLDIRIVRQLHTYSNPERDSRFYAVTTVFVAEGKGSLKPGTDAEDIRVLKTGCEKTPKLAFDHNRILLDYLNDSYGYF